MMTQPKGLCLPGVKAFETECSLDQPRAASVAQPVSSGLARARGPKLRAILLVVLLSLVGLASMRAQQVTATLVGTVTDSQGAVIPDASLKATNLATGISHTSASGTLGDYRIEFLPVGDYTLTATAKGFRSTMQKNVHLIVDQTQRVDIALTVGSVDQTVTVTEAPPMVDTSTAEIGRTVESEEILSLPLVNRNIYSQLTLTPGVMSMSGTASNPTAQLYGQPYQDTVINGGWDANTPQVGYYLDGGLNTTGLRNDGGVAPNPDAVAEFRVETNNFNAQYGRFSAAVVTVVTKSGTNALHGSAYEFYRDKIFNATNWNAGGVLVPYHRNQYGFTAGGPIIKNRTFVFGSYGAVNQNTGQFISGAIVPTLAERTGNFSQSTTTPIDPTGLNQFTGGVIPTTRFDPTANYILQTYIPKPIPGVSQNKFGVDNGWKGAYTSPLIQKEVMVRVDHEFSSTHHVSATYFYNKNELTSFAGGNIAPYNQQYDPNGQTNGIISDVKVLSPTLTNQAWATVIHDIGGRTNSPQTSLADMSKAAGVSSTTTNPIWCPNGCHTFVMAGQPQLPGIGVSGYFTLSGANMGPEAGTNFYSLRDLVSYTHGKHSIEIGGEWSLNKDVQNVNIQAYGLWSFSTAAPHTTKNALADFMTGNVNNLSQQSPVVAIDNFWMYAAFVQDDYRVTPRLTLNLGLRYDLMTPPTDPQNKQATFVPGRQSVVDPSSPPDVLYPGDPGVTRGTVMLQKDHIAPRIGIAWDPFGDGKTSIRAAGGIFYGSPAGNQWNNSSNALPFAVSATFGSVNSLSDVYGPVDFYGNPTSFANGNPFPYTYNPKKATWTILDAQVQGANLNEKWPVTYQINASVQRQIRHDLSATVAYVGNLGRKLPMQLDVNYPQFVPGATNSAASVRARRPWEAQTNNLVGPALLYSSISSSSFHALQVSAQKTMSKNFSINGYYQWSHAFWAAYFNPQDYNNLWEERGPADYDQRHIAVLSGTWNISYFTGANSVLRQVLNGWTLSPIVTLHSGTPVNITTADNNMDNGEGTNRPNRVPGVNPFLDPHRSRQAAAAQWFNPAAFINNGYGQPGGIGPYGVDGNVGRDFLVGPGYHDVDLGAFRTVTVEHYALQLRAEATNVFNNVSLGNPTANLTSGNNGKITGAQGSQRILQLGARFTF